MVIRKNPQSLNAIGGDQMKLSKRTETIISKLQNDADWHMAIASRRARNDQTLPDYFDKPASYYQGLAWGKYSAIACILAEHKAYKGFSCEELSEGFETQHYYI
jgi:hypothetical protein